MMTRNEIVDRFVSELTRVAGALLETSASSRAGTPAGGDGFILRLEPSDGQGGYLEAFFARPGAAAFAKAAAGAETTPADDQIIATLKEAGSQAAAALDPRDVGTTLKVDAVETLSEAAASIQTDAQAAIAVEIVINGQPEPLQVVVTGALDIVAAGTGRMARSETLDVIMDIDLPLVVRFGRTDLPLKTLTALGPGSVIDLGRTPDEPVDVLISNRVVARGEVVIVSGHYGVRVRDVVSPAERARSLEAEIA